MPMRRHEPVPEKLMINGHDGHHTICQTLRDIYSLTDNKEIKLKCRIGMSMAKSMHNRLKFYRKTVGLDSAKKIERTFENNDKKERLERLKTEG